jgi:hypothetical protein
MSIEKDRVEEHRPRYIVRVNFKKTIYYGDRSGPGVMFSSTHATYTTTNTKDETVTQLYNAKGIWAGEETIWVPCCMFAYIEFQREHQ